MVSKEEQLVCFVLSLSRSAPPSQAILVRRIYWMGRGSAGGSSVSEWRQGGEQGSSFGFLNSYEETSIMIV